MRLDKFTYMLAPLEDMTDSSFRTLCYRYGADLTFTELIRFESLAKNNKTTWERTIIPDDTPTVIQIIGHKEQFLKKFLNMFEPKNGFKGFNLNLGCPAPNFVNNGIGCAMIKRVTKTKKLVEIIRDYKYPVSIKMRLGLNKYEKERKAYLNLINGVNADFFIVHGRHGAQTYNEPSDWSVYPECIKTGKDIIANGDIRTIEGVKQLKDIGLKGVMIGREAIKNPLIFAKLKGLEMPTQEKLLEEYNQLSGNAPFRYKKNILKHLGKEDRFEEEK